MLKQVEEDNEVQYWLGLFTGTSWNQYLAAKTPQIGFNIKQIKQAQKIKPGDRIIAYLTKVGSFVGILEATSYALVSDEEKWSEGLFPVRVNTNPLMKVTIPLSIPIRSLLNQLSFSKDGQLKSQHAWTVHVRSSPRRWKTEDGILIENKLKEQIKNPVLFIIEQDIAKLPSIRKASKVNTGNRVGRLNRRTKRANFETTILDKSKRVLSKNTVTGYAVNFPIQKTCRPTKVCKDTCYFAAGLNATSPALTLQHRNLDHCRMDPESFAQRVIYEYDNAGINYLRWNGGGDLFDEAVDAIEFIRVHRPDIVLWIVTRKPEIASQLKFHQNHYIHVSLDQTSYFKRAQIRSMFSHNHVFFSYQVHPDEELSQETIENNRLIFMHDYASPPELANSRFKGSFCPLNGAASIKDMCNRCRKCFDGTFVNLPSAIPLKVNVLP